MNERTAFHMLPNVTRSLNMREYWVLGHIATYGSGGRWCTDSVRRMAALCELSPSTVQNILDRLCSLGWVERDAPGAAKWHSARHRVAERIWADNAESSQGVYQICTKGVPKPVPKNAKTGRTTNTNTQNPHTPPPDASIARVQPLVVNGSETSTPHPSGKPMTQNFPPAPRPARDPVTDMFNAKVRADDYTAIIGKWKTTATVKEICAAFVAESGIQVTARDSAKWVGGAQRCAEVYGGDVQIIRQAVREARGRFYATHPGALVEVIKALRAVPDSARASVPAAQDLDL